MWTTYVVLSKPGEVLLTWTDEPDDPQYEISRQALETLSAATDARGRPLVVHKIHQPDPMAISAAECEGLDAGETAKPRMAGDRLAASYVNFYIANGGIVMPLFDDAHDRTAMDLLVRLFPDRKVVGVRSREILLGGGNIHCITQQIPMGECRPVNAVLLNRTTVVKSRDVAIPRVTWYSRDEGCA